MFLIKNIRRILCGEKNHSNKGFSQIFTDEAQVFAENICKKKAAFWAAFCATSIHHQSGRKNVPELVPFTQSTLYLVGQSPLVIKLLLLSYPKVIVADLEAAGIS